MKETVKAAMKAAYRLDWKEGIARLKKRTEWLEREHPAAARSLMEGLEETFTINPLGFVAVTAQESGDNQYHREPKFRGETKDQASVTVAQRRDGPAPGGSRAAGW
jgi:hypothetical protein